VAHTHSSRRNVAHDLPLALVVHGGLAAVVLTTRLGAPPDFDAPPFTARSAFLWLTPWSIEVPPPEPDVAVEPAPEPARDAPLPAPEPSAASQSSPPPAVTEQAESDSAASPPARPAIDWEQQRRAVIDQLRGAPSGRYSTFSADDFIAAPTPPRTDRAPSGEIFSPNTHVPSLLSPSQQHSCFVRKLADICHALTGGFGVAFQGFALFNACAAEGGRSDLFAAIKPEYLKVVPDCTTDLPKEVTEQMPPTLVRCRLVAPADESAEPVRE
jgi:hypothetical protein